MLHLEERFMQKAATQRSMLIVMQQFFPRQLSLRGDNRNGRSCIGRTRAIIQLPQWNWPFFLYFKHLSLSPTSGLFRRRALNLCPEFCPPSRNSFSLRSVLTELLGKFSFQKDFRNVQIISFDTGLIPITPHKLWDSISLKHTSFQLMSQLEPEQEALLYQNFHPVGSLPSLWPDSVSDTPIPRLCSRQIRFLFWLWHNLVFVLTSAQLARTMHGVCVTGAIALLTAYSNLPHAAVPLIAFQALLQQ
jgi:hypothetical protein